MVGRTVAFAHNVGGHGGAAESVSTCAKVDLRRAVSGTTAGVSVCLKGVEFVLKSLSLDICVLTARIVLEVVTILKMKIPPLYWRRHVYRPC